MNHDTSGISSGSADNIPQFFKTSVKINNTKTTIYQADHKTKKGKATW